MTTNDKPVCYQVRVLLDNNTWGIWHSWDSAESREACISGFDDGCVYEVRDLYARPQPAAPQGWRDAVADEYLDAIEKAGDILGQAADGETLHEACARVVAERDALLEMNAAQAATIARIQSDGLHVATLHRHPARGELRVEYADDVTELPDGDYKILAYKATDIRGDTCHFGVESTARAWAKSGSVEAVHVRQLRALATPPAPEPDEDDYESDDRFVGHLYANAPEQPKPAGDVEALLERYREWIQAIPVGTEDQSRGASAYSWHMTALYQLRRLAAQPAQGEVSE